MIRNLKEYFSFTRRETRALLLALIILLITFTYRIWIGRQKADKFVLTEDQKEEIQMFINSFELKSKETSNQYENSRITKAEISPEYFVFNPNLMDREEMKKLGLDEFVADNIIKYREAGGKFAEPGDLRKIYGMKESLYKRLEPYVNLPDQSIEEKISDYENSDPGNSRQEKIILEINSAGFGDLMKIQGMEPGIAGRIINYRDLIGGFYSSRQLDEVYGMNDSINKILTPSIIIDSSLIRKLSLGSASFSDLLRHPYLSKTDVSRIFSLKNYYRDSICIEHIIQNKILPESTLFRIMPYFEN